MNSPRLTAFLYIVALVFGLQGAGYGQFRETPRPEERGIVKSIDAAKR